MKAFTLSVVVCLFLAACDQCKDIEPLMIIPPEGIVSTVNVDLGEETYEVASAKWDPGFTGGSGDIKSSYNLTGVTSGTGSTLEGVHFNIGNTKVSWKVTDVECSNEEDACSYDIHVIDNNIEGSWENRAPMPLQSAAFTACAAMDKVYYFGGGPDRDSRSDKAYRYDPLTDKWNELPPLMYSRWMLTSAACNGTIYAIGGGWPDQFFDQVEAFDVMTETWSMAASMPTARANCAATCCNGKIYVLGGFTAEESNVNLVEMYDPELNSWEQKSGMEFGRGGLAAVSIGNKVYAIGGGDINTQSILEEYDTDKNIWARKSDLPKGYFALAATVWNGKIIVSGGTTSSMYDATKAVQVYDPALDMWSSMSSMVMGRQWHALVTAGDHIYVLGGENRCIMANPDATIYNAVECFVPSED